MRESFRRVGFFVAIVFVMPTWTVSAQLTEQDREVIEWLKELDSGDLAKHKPVEVTVKWWTGSSSETSDEIRPAHETKYTAFLLKDKTDAFDVITIGMDTLTFERRNKSLYGRAEASYEPIDIIENAKRFLDDHRSEMKKDFLKRRSELKFGPHVEKSFEFVAFATVCAGKNHEALAREFMKEAEPLVKRYHQPKDKNVSFLEAVQNQLAHFKMWRAIVAIDDPDIAYEEILDDVEIILKNAPQSPHRDRAAKTKAMLQQLIKERKPHKASEEVSSLRVEDQVREWIYQLRNQDGAQWSQPGSCDIFCHDRLQEIDLPGVAKQKSIKRSPAAHLVELGFSAVPQLIETLDDDRFSRSVGYHRNFFFSHHVLTVGECARQILCRIAHRNLKDRGEAISWWQDIQEKGEKRVLVEGVIQGTRNSVHQARQLAKAFPKDALDAITQGAANTTSDYVERNLIEQAAGFGDAAEPFLTRKMLRAKKLESRIVAAKQLLPRKRNVVLKAMINEWHRVKSKKQPIDSEGSLIEFLVTCNDVTTIEALHKGFDQHDVSIRLNIISNLGLRDGSLGASLQGTGLTFNIPDEPPVFQGAIADAVESLLVTGLYDLERRHKLKISWGDYEDENPRVCDFAGHVLNQRFGGKYQFNAKGTMEEKEKQRLQILSDINATGTNVTDTEN